jgi:hypothetical protein
MNNLPRPKSVSELDAETATSPSPHSTSNVECSMSNVSKISSRLSSIKNLFDYLGGSREAPPLGAAYLTSPLWLGIWWGVLIGLILLFCGQTSKFIYIDF